MRRLPALLWCGSFVFAFGSSPANFVCNEERPEILSLTVNMPLAQLQKTLGPGVLDFKAPDGAAERQGYYSWRHGSVRLKAAFDGDRKAIWVNVSSPRQFRVFKNVVLNRDTARSLKGKFGNPPSETGPMYGEGEYALYSLEYHCGPDGSYNVTFTADLDCARPDMDACLDKTRFESRPIRTISISRGNPGSR